MNMNTYANALARGLRLLFAAALTISGALTSEGVVRASPPMPVQAQHGHESPVLLSVDIGALTQRAHLILIGRAESVSSRFATNQYGDEIIVSDISIKPEEILKGQLPLDTNLVLKDLKGGTVGDVAMISFAAPIFVQDERIVLFLEEGSNGLDVIEGEIGKFTVDEAGQVPQLGWSLARFRAEVLYYAGDLYTDQSPVWDDANPAEKDLVETQPEVTESAQSLQVIDDPQSVYTLARHKWSGEPPVMEFYINNPGFRGLGTDTVSLQDQAIMNGAVAWNELGRANFTAKFAGDTTIGSAAEDGRNVVIVRHASHPKNQVYEIVLKVRNDVISECDIVFYDHDHTFSYGDSVSSDALDIQSVATHAFGHCLGLSDSFNDDSLMHYRFHKGQPGALWMRALHVRDIDNITALYGTRVFSDDQILQGDDEAQDLSDAARVTDGMTLDASTAQAETSLLTSLRGDTSCEWGAANCNRCVWNVSAELDRLQNNYRSAGRIRFAGYAYPTPGYILHRISNGSYEHVQSIGRIAGVGNNEYMVFTHSTASGQSGKQGALAVVRMGAGQNTGGGPFYGMPYGSGSNQNTSNRTVARTYAGNNHPGGLSVLGHYVYVAQWCQDHGNYGWCNESSATVHGMGFSVYDVSKANLNSSINSNPPIHRYYRHVYGESWIGSKSTASVAAVKLSSGQYLVALGRSGGREYGFYTATSPTGPFTFHNSSRIGYWGENATIVTECSTGDLYMFQIEGYGSSDDVDKVHLYKLVLNNGLIGFQYVKSRTFHCRGSSIDGASNWCHFDAGAGMYVTPGGNLILYATDWHQSSYGNIRLVEFR